MDPDRHPCETLANHFCLISTTVITLFTRIEILSDTAPTLAKLSVLRTTQGGKIRIIWRLANIWYRFGILLDFDESGQQLEDIRCHYSDDSEACCRATLQHWLKGNGVQPCSWRKLIEVLEDCDFEVLAEEIRDALSEQPT